MQRALTPGITMPAAAVMASRLWTSSACWNHLSASGSAPSFRGSNLPGTQHQGLQQTWPADCS